MATEIMTKETILPVLYEALNEEYGQEREGIHVSDLIYCPRKSVFQKLHPLPKTNLELNFFTSGKAIHAALQSLVKKYPDRFEIEKEVWFNDVVAHIDMYDNNKKMPIEAKSARMKTIGAPKPHNIAQLEAYMALTHSDKGIILYQLLLHFEDKPFVEFEHTMTKKQRIDTLVKLVTDSHKLKAAIKNKDASIARHVAYDKDYNWLCKSCPYAKSCEMMRTDEREGMFEK